MSADVRVRRPSGRSFLRFLVGLQPSSAGAPWLAASYRICRASLRTGPVLRRDGRVRFVVTARRSHRTEDGVVADQPREPDERLDSWKAIAAYLGRTERTV